MGSGLYTLSVHLILLFGPTLAFQSRPRSFSKPDSTKLQESFLDQLKSTFSGEKLEQLDYQTFKPTVDGLTRQAKRLVASDFGLQDPSLLDDNFISVSAYEEKALSKDEYLAAGKFFDVRTAFPDLDYRAYDFRVDEGNDSTLRMTCRTTGTMRGPLNLRGETLQPTGNTMRCPPECVSITFDKDSGKVKQLLYPGFVMDRQIGNTGGTTGVLAASTIGGKPPSDFDLFPISSVISRFLGRPVPQITESTEVLAPFPEQVMVSLAKGVIASTYGTSDPSLLSKNFAYTSPYDGPVGKEAFLDKYATEIFGDTSPEYSNFRIDLYDVFRVWADVIPKATGYDGHLQAVSFTFDKDGYCTRLTTDYVIDPTKGNGGGLGAVAGLKYATGKGSIDILTRPIPRAASRLGKVLLSPVTGIKVDEYRSSGKATVAPSPTPKPATDNTNDATKSVLTPTSPVEKAKSAVEAPKKDDAKALETLKNAAKSASISLFSASENSKLSPTKPIEKKPTKPTKPISSNSAPKSEKKEPKKDNAQALESLRNAAKSASISLLGLKPESKQVSTKPVAKKKPAPTLPVAKPPAAKVAPKTKTQTSKKQTDDPKALDILKNAAKSASISLMSLTSDSKTSKPDSPKPSKTIAVKRKQPDDKKATQKVLSSTPGATISLFGLGGTVPGADGSKAKTEKASPSSTGAPKGVPSLRRWRKNADGSITGRIFGSGNFEKGAEVTTSPIKSGDVKVGSIVRTGSGSRYFLE